MRFRLGHPYVRVIAENEDDGVFARRDVQLQRILGEVINAWLIHRDGHTPGRKRNLVYENMVVGCIRHV